MPTPALNPGETPPGEKRILLSLGHACPHALEAKVRVRAGLHESIVSSTRRRLRP